MVVYEILTQHYPFDEQQVRERSFSDNIANGLRPSMMLIEQKERFMRNSDEHTEEDVNAFIAVVRLMRDCWNSNRDGELRPRAEIGKHGKPHMSYSKVYAW